MKLKKKVVLALSLAFASLTVQAQNKGMDIGLGQAPQAASQSGPQAPQQPATMPKPSPAPQAAANAQVSRPAPAAVRQEAPAKDVPAPTVTRRVERTPPMPAQPKFTRAVAQPQPQPQPVAEVQPLPAPVAQRIAAPVAPISAPRQASLESDTNPFTGKGLSAEYRQRQLEEAKMDTDLIQEKLKQANLIADLTYLPLKKKAEVSTLPGIAAAANSTSAAAPTKPAGNGQAQGANEGGSEAPAKPAVRKVKKAKAPKKVEPAMPTQPPAPVAPSITISGISINGTHASAIIETDAGVMSAQNGESTPFGQLRVIDQRTVTLGGRTFTVRDAMLSRMMVSDPAPVDPDKARNAPQAIVPVAPPVNIPLPPLPPLPAPPRNLAASKAPVPGM